MMGDRATDWLAHLRCPDLSNVGLRLSPGQFGLHPKIKPPGVRPCGY
jgi:hypothetical protein